MRVSLLINDSSKSLRLLKAIIGIVPIVILLIILNNNFVFTGIHRINISSFLHLPASVQYVGSAEVGVVSTLTGNYTRPYQDSIDFAVTLPRGFDTMTMKAEVDADPYATLILRAKVSPTASKTSAFRLPTAFGSDWRSTTLDGGRLQLRDHANIQNAEAFWAAFQTFRKVYTVSGDLVSAIPKNLYAESVKIEDVHLNADYRGSLTLNAYLDSSTKEVRFFKRDLDYSSGTDTLNFTLERGGKLIVEHNLGDGNGESQEAVVPLPEIVGGFYTLHFTPNNEDSVVSSIRFRGAEVLMQGNIFLGPSAEVITYYTTCSKFTVEAVHALGLESSINVNGRHVTIKTLKKAQEVRANTGVSTITIPRGDVSIYSQCGFSLEREQPTRDAFNALTKRIVLLPEFTNATLRNIDVVFDDTQLAQIKTKSGYIIEKSFDLHTLAAKGKTFTFSIESPGLTTRTGAYLHIKSITFTAKRPPFSFADITKVFKVLLKR